MAAIRTRRVILGTLAGGVVWIIWSSAISFLVLMPRYADAQKAGWLLVEPRYRLFVLYWFVMLFLLTYILTWVYVAVRNTLGPGPVTALRVGLLMGFLSGFPISFSLSTWAPFSRVIPMGWLMDLWVGAILATFVSASIYKES